MSGQPQIVYASQGVLDQVAMGASYGIDAHALVVTQSLVAGASMPPSEVIDPSVPWTITLKFRIGGGGAIPIVTSSHTGNVNFYFEGLGSAPEGTLAGPIGFDTLADGTYSAVSNATEYEIKATILPATSPLVGNPGLYLLSASVDLAPFPGMRLLAFVEGPMVQAY